jgi:stress response protein YsnF
MERHGAIDIDRRSETWKREGWSGSEAHDAHFGETRRTEGVERGMGEGTATGTNYREGRTHFREGATDIREGGSDFREGGSTAGQERVIPVVEEDLKLGKREVPGQTVRMYSHVTETPVEERVDLHEERVSVERRPVDRPATELESFKEGSVEVRETREEPVVSKEAGKGGGAGRKGRHQPDGDGARHRPQDRRGCGQGRGKGEP